MKLIFAAVRPSMIDRIIGGLEEIENFPGITISDADGFGRRAVSGHPMEVNPMKSTKQIKIAANEEMVERIVGVLRECGHTGRRGDGIVVVLPIESVFHI